MTELMYSSDLQFQIGVNIQVYNKLKPEPSPSACARASATSSASVDPAQSMAIRTSGISINGGFSKRGKGIISASSGMSISISTTIMNTRTNIPSLVYALA